MSRGSHYFERYDPNCTFKERKCFARKDGKCQILLSMPRPRKGHKCPFCKECRDDIVK